MFFGDIKISKQKNSDSIIKYPIKIEYYKTKDGESNMYGIKIVTKEYKLLNTKVEEKTISKITESENEIEKILNIFIQNQVTTIGAEDIIEDIFKNTCKL